MINASNGEVYFSDGLAIAAHCPVDALLKLSTSSADGAATRSLPALPGWSQHLLGIHSTEYGDFECEVTCAPTRRVCAVFLSHIHPFYKSGTLDDSDRRTYHEGVIQTDLRGQREFPWGNVGSRRESAANHHWLVVAYSRGVHVPLSDPERLRELINHEKEPGNSAYPIGSATGERLGSNRAPVPWHGWDGKPA